MTEDIKQRIDALFNLCTTINTELQNQNYLLHRLTKHDNHITSNSLIDNERMINRHLRGSKSFLRSLIPQNEDGGKVLSVVDPMDVDIVGGFDSWVSVNHDQDNGGSVGGSVSGSVGESVGGSVGGPVGASGKRVGGSVGSLKLSPGDEELETFDEGRTPINSEDGGIEVLLREDQVDTDGAPKAGGMIDLSEFYNKLPSKPPPAPQGTPYPSIDQITSSSDESDVSYNTPTEGVGSTSSILQDEPPALQDEPPALQDEVGPSFHSSSPFTPAESNLGCNSNHVDGNRGNRGNHGNHAQLERSKSQPGRAAAAHSIDVSPSLKVFEYTEEYHCPVCGLSFDRNNNSLEYIEYHVNQHYDAEEKEE